MMSFYCASIFSEFSQHGPYNSWPLSVLTHQTYTGTLIMNTSRQCRNLPPLGEIFHHTATFLGQMLISVGEIDFYQPMSAFTLFYPRKKTWEFVGISDVTRLPLPWISVQYVT